MPLLGLLAVVAGLCLVPMAETDLYFRLAVGDEILRTGALPRRNLFSFTFPEHPDLDPSWLFDVGAAALYRAGGFPAVVLGKTLLVLAIFAAAYQVCRRRGAAALPSALALAAAALVMHERLVERPHLFSLAGEVAVLSALDRERRAWLVPATALWANLHAGAFLAPLLLALALAGDLADQRRLHRRTLLVAAGSLLALMATPVGTGIFRYLAAHVGLFAIHPVDEFRPASWTSDAPLVLFAAATLVLARGSRWRERLPALGLALLAARSVRFGADFALVAAPLVATGLSRWQPLGDRRAAALGTAGLVVVALGPRLPHPRLALGADTSELPLDALRFVDEHGLRARMYNDFEVGAYLLWQGWPRHRVFVDPRLPAYPRSFHRLLGDPHLDRAAWDAALEGFGVDSALLANAGINHRIALWDPTRWALVYRAHDARVFVRRLPRWQALIAAREIPASFQFTVQDGAVTVPLAAPPAGSPVAACEWQRRLGELLFELQGATAALPAYVRALDPPGCLTPPDAAAAAAWAGVELFNRGQPAAALPYLERAPDELPILTDRALALEALGRSGEAMTVWRHIAERARGTPLGQRAATRAGR
jgi:hypothetical protein